MIRLIPSKIPKKNIPQMTLYPAENKKLQIATDPITIHKIPVGTFAVEGKVSSRDIIHTIFTEGPIRLRLTIPEGSSSTQIFLNANNLLEKSDDYNKLFMDPIFISEFDIKASSLEGYLFPDTYYFFKDSSSREILTTMINEFWINFDKTFMERTNELGFTVHELSLIHI